MAYSIYRLNNDVINKTPTTRAQVPRTTGFAITALFGAGYGFSTNTSIKGMFGQKIINRETNPDGLSREWVASLCRDEILIPAFSKVLTLQNVCKTNQ